MLLRKINENMSSISGNKKEKYLIEWKLYLWKYSTVPLPSYLLCYFWCCFDFAITITENGILNMKITIFIVTFHFLMYEINFYYNTYMIE